MKNKYMEEANLIFLISTDILFPFIIIFLIEKKEVNRMEIFRLRLN